MQSSKFVSRGLRVPMTGIGFGSYHCRLSKYRSLHCQRVRQRFCQLFLIAFEQLHTESKSMYKEAGDVEQTWFAN